MAAAALELADHVIVTDDNPRNESPQAIVAEILAGVALTRNAASPPRVEHDRATAIHLANALAGADDAVGVAGKGPEDYQIYGNEVRARPVWHFVPAQLGHETRRRSSTSS